MKIHLITTYYQPFIQNFLKRNLTLDQLSFLEIQQLILNEFFADTGSTYYWLKQNGHEVFLSITNFEILQKKWAHENAIAFDNNDWSEKIIIEQIKSFKTEVVYTESIQLHTEDFLKEVKLNSKMLVAWVSFPFVSLPNLKYFDLVLTSTKDYKNKFKKQGLNSEYMLPAFDERILKNIPPVNKNISLSFVGGISEIHKHRWEALNYLCKHTDLSIWGYGLPKKEQNLIKRFYTKDAFNLIRKHHNGEAWGLDMYNILSSSYITFNVHEELLKGDVGNMRMFEATGVGTMLLNDYGNNLNELFEPEKEIVTYKTLPEALEKYTFYSEHKEKAIEIGLNGQKKTLANYNYKVYVNSMMGFIKNYLK